LPLVRQHACGLVIEPGDGHALAEALISLREDPLRAAEIGKRARTMLDACFTRKQAFARWQSLLATLTTRDDFSSSRRPFISSG
jgi:glycosyltransferase involved in cell wall biosynthesis